MEQKPGTSWPRRTTWLHSVLILLWLSFPTMVFGQAPDELLGAWESPSGTTYLFEKARLVIHGSDGYRVRGIEVGAGQGMLKIRRMGHTEVWCYELRHADQLSLQPHGGEIVHLRRLAEVPSRANIQPVALGPFKSFSRARVEAIQRELATRNKKDQAALKSREKEAIEKVQAANTAFLIDLVQRVGWIDVERFGEEASFDAVMLAKHSRDLPLMSAVLPHVEDDFKKPGPTAQGFAILFDGLQLRLGHKQLYGTQMGEDEGGHTIVLPLADPENVDRHRAEIGLPPLADYLELVNGVLPYGEKVRVAGSEQ